MSVALWFQDRWTNRVRQFGLRAALAQAARAAIRPVCDVKRYMVMAIREHRPEPVVFPEIRPVTVEDVDRAADRGELTERQRTLLSGFLAEGCSGFLAEVEGRLAGYGFVQPAGIYAWGGIGRFQAPDGMVILKNLLVFPGFRGHSLGKKLNETRIASIPSGRTPIVFVMTENRYAIRNLKMFGFEEMMIVTRRTWFKRWTWQTVLVLNDGAITERLLRGLRDYGKGNGSDLD